MRSRRQNTRGGRERAFVVQVLIFTLILLFGCGALFFAFQIFDTVREAVVLLGVPDINDLPSFVGQPSAARATGPNLAAGERVNILLLGIDRGESGKCPCRSDTMIIASLDPKTLTAGVVTIPRDLYVPIPDIGENRINTANFFGELYKYPGGGPGLAKRTVEYNLGRRIHYYVLVDFNGFRKLIDNGLGGVDIDVPKTIDDPKYPDENYGYKPLHIQAGRVHMNGELALQYARTRHQDGDFGRSQRQIQILLAMREKALRLDLLPRLPQLLQSMWGTVETDLTPQDVITLAQVAAKVKKEGIKSHTIDQSMTVELTLSTNAAVLWPIRDKIGRMMDQVIPQEGSSADQAKRVQQEGARILVLNGTGNALLAEQTARYLQGQGFQISAYGNADRMDYAKTVLIDYSGLKGATVTALVNILRIDPGNIRSNQNVKSDEDIRLILGSDWTLPKDK